MRRTPLALWLGITVAVFVGFAITGLGFRLQWHQMDETIRGQSVAPLMNPSANLKIAICTPVIALGFKLADVGIPLFVLLVIGNILFWAGLVMLIARMAFRWPGVRGSPEPAA